MDEHVEPLSQVAARDIRAGAAIRQASGLDRGLHAAVSSIATSGTGPETYCLGSAG
jgi:hypothetical protein